MMKTQNTKHISAFTLVETMVAVVILGMAIAAMHSTWMAILGATKSGARASAQIQRERVALSTMELALNCSIIYFNENRQNQGLTNAYSFVATNMVVAGDEFQSISFVARLPEDFLGSSYFPNQPIRRVSLGVEQTQSGRSDLIMRQWQLTKVEHAMEEGDEGLAITLARNVDVFKVKFWSTSEEYYVDFWEQPEVLPKRMRLFLALRDEEGVEAGFEALSLREFALVTDVIAEDMISPDPPPASSRGGGATGGRPDWASIKRRIDGAVKSGRITREQGNRMMEGIKKRMMEGGGQGSGRGPVKAVRPSPGGSKGGGFRGTIVGPGGSGGSGKSSGRK